MKQEKKVISGNVGKENLDENVDDPPPVLPVKPARAAKKLPQVQVQASLKVVLNRTGWFFSTAQRCSSCTYGL